MSNHRDLHLDSVAVEELCKKVPPLLRRKAHAGYCKSAKGKTRVEKTDKRRFAKAGFQKTEKRKEGKAGYKRREKGE